jgi:hypothetical protein
VTSQLARSETAVSKSESFASRLCTRTVQLAREANSMACCRSAHRGKPCQISGSCRAIHSEHQDGIGCRATPSLNANANACEHSLRPTGVRDVSTMAMRLGCSAVSLIHGDQWAFGEPGQDARLPEATSDAKFFITSGWDIES